MAQLSQPIAETLGQWSLRPGALHERLADALRDAIARGQLASGVRLPAERALARMLSVSRTTVAAAYTSLARDGQVEGRRGSGTYVRGVPRVRALHAASAVPQLPRALAFHQSETGSAIDLTCATAEGPGLLDDEVVAAAFADPAMRSGHGYFPAGTPRLREAIAAYLGRGGLPTEPAQVIVTSGALQAIGLIASLVLRRGDRVAVESTTFPGALDVLTAPGARLTPVPMDEDGVRLDALPTLVEEHGARLAYFIPSFHNPTGALLPAAARRQLAQLASDLDLTVVDDTTMHDLWLSEPPPPPVGSFAPDGPVITVGSASKLFWGGLRIGWARAPEAVVSRLAGLKIVADLGSSIPSQALAAALLQRSEEIGERRRAGLAASAMLLAELLEEHLPTWEWRLPRGGLTLWARLPRGSADELAQVALRHGVVILPGTACSARGDDHDHVRLPLVREADILVEGIRRLARAWADYEPGAARAEQRELSVVV